MYPLASVALSSADIDLTNIPQTFNHLQLRVFSRDTGNQSTTSYSATGYMSFNNDTASINYSVHFLYGSGSVAGSGSYAPNYNIMQVPELGGPYSGQLANTYACAIIDILDYTNTNKYKTVRFINGVDMNGYGRVFFQSGLWRNTSAINRIKIANDGGTFAANSRIDLYGISTSNATGA
jgi:hypothetical protein